MTLMNRQLPAHLHTRPSRIETRPFLHAQRRSTHHTTRGHTRTLRWPRLRALRHQCCQLRVLLLCVGRLRETGMEILTGGQDTNGPAPGLRKPLSRPAAPPRKLTTIESMLAGALASSATVIITNPIWVVNTRMTARGAAFESDLPPPGGKPAKKSSTLGALLSIIRDEGRQRCSRVWCRRSCWSSTRSCSTRSLSS